MSENQQPKGEGGQRKAGRPTLAIPRIRRVIYLTDAEFETVKKWIEDTRKADNENKT